MARYKRLQLPAQIDSLTEFRGFVLQQVKQCTKSKKVLFAVKLALEEILANVIYYAYDKKEKGFIDVGCALVADKKFSIQVKDCGKLFNPLKHPEPDLTLEAEERAVGGLGVFLAKSVTDEMRYRRIQNHNVLTLSYSLERSRKKKDAIAV